MRRSHWQQLVLVSGLLVVAACPVASASDTAVDSLSVSVPQEKILSRQQWDALNLGRSVDLWLKNDLRGAAELLETIDISAGSSFDRADRAAFLLAIAYLRLGDDAAFHRVAAVAGGDSASVYRQWIRYARSLKSAEGTAPERDITSELPAGFPGAEVLAAALLLEMDRAGEASRLLASVKPDGPVTSLQLYLQALAREAAGDDATREWEQLANRKAKNHLEADLVASALLKLAVARLGSEPAARKLLERIPPESRHASRAAHMLGLMAAEAGDSSRAHEILAGILVSDPTYEERREVELSLGAIAMERGDWRTSIRLFTQAENDWGYELESLDHLDNEVVLAEIWQIWEERNLWREEIRLSPDVLFYNAHRLADASLDLRRDLSLDPKDIGAEGFWPVTGVEARRASWDRTDALSRHYPRSNEWDRLRRVQRQRQDAASRLARQERLIERQQELLGQRLRYLRAGRDRAASSTEDLASAVVRLDRMLAEMNAAVAQLEAVRDSALLDIATRTTAMAEHIRRELFFVQAIQHWHVEGPHKARPEAFPSGVPSPAQLLVMESVLARQSADFLSLFASHYSAVIARSFEEVWEPRLTGDSRSLHAALLAALARARGIGADLDSIMAAHVNDPAVIAALARRDELAAALDSLQWSENDLRREIASAVAERGRRQLASEREAIDYHLADASYELAVELATDPATAENAPVVTPARADAVARVDSFLVRYPESFARGESRFRLADLRLMQARDDFQGRMAHFLGEDPSADDLENRSLAPFVDYAPAVELYQAILAEDTSFPHQDAVLFNLGMILSDDGQPAAAGHLMRLVQEYPNSPNAQEAWLRMGGDRFDRKDFAGCVALFEKAAAGDDPSFTAIALYKLGWAQFEEDRFRSSADAFRRLMDLYGEHHDVAKAMDLRDEAEEYLVHSLARSGGAEAFRVYFDEIGGRDYEDRILIALGHLMGSLSLYEEAAACDLLWLERYPLHRKAFAVSERVVRTYRNWNKPDLAREAKLAQAERFLPGSAWYAANEDEALHADAERFARSAYRENAAYYHQRARTGNDVASWRVALTNYETYLAHWPRAADSPRMHFMSGETAASLEDYPRALAHFGAAARSDSVALAKDATWQQLAVTDTWYRNSRAGAGAIGADSLATKLIASGHDFVLLYPTDERCADVVWRQGNLAYAHEWYADAAISLASMSERFPADPRATSAIRMSGDARYQLGEFDAAGTAYERAIVLARSTNQDSVVTTLEAAVPLCYYKHAESIAAADTVSGDRNAAPLFARVAERWPAFEHADLALYRAGLGFAAHKSYADAASAWERLIALHPDSEYARDSAVQIARAYEASGNTRNAARAYERFSKLHPDDPDAAEALLHAIDLLAEAKDDPGAEEMRTLFVERFPDETETVMEIRADRAARELAQVTSGALSITSLLAAKGAADSGAAASELQAYLQMAAVNPELATPALLAQVDYIKAEESYPAYAAIKLTQPLPESLQRKKKKLEELLKLYDACIRHGVTEYARASANRIGFVLIEFGDALLDSERPGGLSEEDLLAYDEVIEEQSWSFYDRGEDVWTELLQQIANESSDPGDWIARTRAALWPRLAQRFLYQPEVEYPLVRATPPVDVRSN